MSEPERRPIESDTHRKFVAITAVLAALAILAFALILLGQPLLPLVLCALPILFLIRVAEGVVVYRPLLALVKRLLAELRNMGRSDPLTGCLNRRAFSEEAGRLFAPARRYESPIAALMIDPDFFKQVNAEHGHDAGDHVLCAMTGCLLRNLREMDVLARMGGEEFAILLPESGHIAAMLVAQRLRRSVASQRVGGKGGAPISITVSIGVATLQDSDISIFDALHRAEKSLRLAKRNGRDRVESEDLLQLLDTVPDI